MPPIADPEERRKYNREWIAKRKAAYFEGKSCVDCGSTENLEVDHVDPSTKLPGLKTTTKVSKRTAHLWTMSDERRSVELAKCVPRCRTCHQAKTSRERAATRKHGQTLYKMGCRCSICSQSQSERLARYRARR